MLICNVENKCVCMYVCMSPDALASRCASWIAAVTAVVDADPHHVGRNMSKSPSSAAPCGCSAPDRA